MPKVIILGNTALGFNACKSAREESPDAEITLISRENVPAYPLPALFDFAASAIEEKGLFLCDEAWYAAHRVTLVKNAEVARIDDKKQRIVLKDNTKFAYDRLLTFYEKKDFIPDIPGRTKDGIFALDSFKNAKEIKNRLAITPALTIIGESAACLRFFNGISKANKEIKIISAPKPQGFLNTDSAEWIDECAAQEFIGEGAELKAVKLTNGKVIASSLVICVGDLGDQEEADMSADVLVQLGTKGADTIIQVTNDALNKAIAEKGENHAVSFPDTNYFLPLANALLKLEVKTLGDCAKVLEQARMLNANQPTNNGLQVAALGGVLNKGLATLLCEEVVACISGLGGFLSDTLLRQLGIQLVDGRIAGIAVILGPAKDEDCAVQLIRDFQSRSIVSICVGNVLGLTLKQQLENKKVGLGLDHYVVPLGNEYLAAIYAVNWAVRAPLMYGGLKSGQWQEIMRYTKEKVPAFVVLLSHVDEVLVATGLGALALGVPIITDLEVPQLPKIDTTMYEALVTEKDYKKLAAKCIEVRGIKVKVSSVPIPVPYAAAFEGERVRKEQLHAEFGGKASTAFEFLTLKDSAQVEDGKITLVGPDIDQLPPGKKSLPLGIVVEVSGRKMQKDFEPILERQIHRFINYAMGLMHMGQRDMLWIRINQEAFGKGLRLNHLGIAIHAMLHQEYNAIIDKVQVTLYTKQEDVDARLPQVKAVYDERDERLAGMTDESVDTFYSCLLCQSFAPNHVCIITPERLGLCGAYSWLDGKASHEITPTGPNQPVKKEGLVDARLGQWESLNNFFAEKSNRTIEKVSMYSLMDSPQSSCGCFECILAIIPEANGVMVVHRDFLGITPCGMSFTTLAGSVGGGIQTPGFLGVGKLYLTSKKFIFAEGGLKRLVWMPKELKELLGEKLRARAQEIGAPDLFEKIADETLATTTEELVNYLEKVKHPALDLEPLM